MIRLLDIYLKISLQTKKINICTVKASCGFPIRTQLLACSIRTIGWLFLLISKALIKKGQRLTI